jgi:hypothetical protein
MTRHIGDSSKPGLLMRSSRIRLFDRRVSSPPSGYEWKLPIQKTSNIRFAPFTVVPLTFRLILLGLTALVPRPWLAGFFRTTGTRLTPEKTLSSVGLFGIDRSVAHRLPLEGRSAGPLRDGYARTNPRGAKAAPIPSGDSRPSPALQSAGRPHHRSGIFHRCQRPQG